MSRLIASGKAYSHYYNSRFACYHAGESRPVYDNTDSALSRWISASIVTAIAGPMTFAPYCAIDITFGGGGFFYCAL
jgi:hypothetical protein